MIVEARREVAMFLIDEWQLVFVIVFDVKFDVGVVEFATVVLRIVSGASVETFLILASLAKYTVTFCRAKNFLIHCIFKDFCLDWKPSLLKVDYNFCSHLEVQIRLFVGETERKFSQFVRRAFRQKSFFWFSIPFKF